MCRKLTNPKMKKPNNAFSTGKNAWASTLQTSQQNKSKVGRTSQNMPQRKNHKSMTGIELLTKAMTHGRKVSKG